MKYSTAIRRNIDNWFPKDSCKVLADLFISIFDVDSFPAQSTPQFTVYGDNEIDLLTAQFFPGFTGVTQQWKAFRFEMVEMKNKLSTLKQQLLDNKIKFKKTSTEWTLNYIVAHYKDEPDFDRIVTLAKIASIVSITNAWPKLVLAQ